MIEIEALAARLHDVYQAEAHRRGDVRHPDRYDEMSEDTKEWDRVLARWVLAYWKPRFQELPGPDLPPTWRDVVREVFPDASDDYADHLLWEHTGFPGFLGKDPRARLLEQLREVAAKERGCCEV